MSNLRPRLRSLFNLAPPHLRQWLRAGGDLIFAENSEISRGHKNATVAQQRSNGMINGPRTSIEQTFCKMKWLGRMTNNPTVMKVFKGPPITPLMHCLAFITNCHTCLEGSQVNSYFGCAPPSLEHYCAGGVTPQY